MVHATSSTALLVLSLGLVSSAAAHGHHQGGAHAHDKMVKKARRAPTGEDILRRAAQGDAHEKRWIWAHSIIQDGDTGAGIPTDGSNANLLSSASYAAATPTATLTPPTFPTENAMSALAAAGGAVHLNSAASASVASYEASISAASAASVSSAAAASILPGASEAVVVPGAASSSATAVVAAVAQPSAAVFKPVNYIGVVALSSNSAAAAAPTVTPAPSVVSNDPGSLEYAKTQDQFDEISFAQFESSMISVALAHKSAASVASVQSVASAASVLAANIAASSAAAASSASVASALFTQTALANNVAASTTAAAVVPVASPETTTTKKHTTTKHHSKKLAATTTKKHKKHSTSTKKHHKAKHTTKSHDKRWVWANSIIQDGDPVPTQHTTPANTAVAPTFPPLASIAAQASQIAAAISAAPSAVASSAPVEDPLIAIIAQNSALLGSVSVSGVANATATAPVATATVAVPTAAPIASASSDESVMEDLMSQVLAAINGLGGSSNKKRSQKRRLDQH